MRGADTFTESLFSVRRLDDFVPDHPLRPVRKIVNEALRAIEPQLSAMYAEDIKGGRPSIAPEKLLRAIRRCVNSSVPRQCEGSKQTRVFPR